MAAGANPFGSPAFNGVSAALAADATVNGNLDNSGMVHIPSPGISTDWTAEEQIALEEGIAKYSGISSVVRYAKIAITLPNKTVRDVALRCRHMNKKEISKRRKEEPSRKSKDKREKVNETSSKQSHFTSQPDNQPFSVLQSLTIEPYFELYYMKNILGKSKIVREGNNGVPYSWNATERKWDKACDASHFFMRFCSLLIGLVSYTASPFSWLTVKRSSV